MIFSDFSSYRFTIFLFFILTLFSCTKVTNTTIGSGLIPPVDGVITKDTVFDVLTKNYSFDSVAVGFSDNHVLGYINDPLFGSTTASINFQVEPSYTPLSFGAPASSIVLDSVILSLGYVGVWGDSSSKLALHVYEIDPENVFSADSSYKNVTSFEKAEGELTDGAQTVNVMSIDDIDTLATNTEVATNTVRLRLNNAFGERLLNYDTSVVYASSGAFNDYFRGFIVQPEQTGNALIQISLSDTSTRLSLYYHYVGTDGVSVSTVARFSPAALTSASSNTIIHNYASTQIPRYVSADTTVHDSILYIQTSPGIYSRISIPGLKGLPNMIVHRAELLMQQIPDNIATDTLFTTPNLFLAAYSQDSMRRFAVPFDVTFSGSVTNLASFGVYPVKKYVASVNDTVASYSFDITRYTQSVVTRDSVVHDFILWAPYNYYIPPYESADFTYPIASPSLNQAAIGRIKLGGGSTSTTWPYKMRFHIVYSLPQ